MPTFVLNGEKILKIMMHFNVKIEIKYIDFYMNIQYTMLSALGED